ncbi:hypothetical protein BDN72DRAFT_966315 [Pluteus cervinus]|uniref:Uncharacterized protein n=1 Tax=Pluteus cervinus TaxID=181527 RepID=A0ACD2ZYQ2_9AGAR|nr:hypothetical protein BDN72DRAFT_966315 [Pluteus cervinus]
MEATTRLMAIDDHHVDPVLPLELECTILQMALESNMADAKNLLFVAKHVFDWLIPVLYKVIVLSREKLYAWPPLPLPTTNLPQYGHHVHHLFAALNTNRPTVDKYLKHCPNIVNFSSWMALSDLQFDLVLHLPLHQLNIRIIQQKHSNPPIPSVFSKITHLTAEVVSHDPSTWGSAAKSGVEGLNCVVCHSELYTPPRAST